MIADDDDVLRCLRDVRDRLADPQRWTTRAPARDASGRAVTMLDGDACAWCLGAAAVLDGDGTLVTRQAMRLLTRAAGGRQVVVWQDTAGRTHAEILAVVDRAMELAREACDA